MGWAAFQLTGQTSGHVFLMTFSNTCLQTCHHFLVTIWLGMLDDYSLWYFVKNVSFVLITANNSFKKIYMFNILQLSPSRIHFILFYFHCTKKKLLRTKKRSWNPKLAKVIQVSHGGRRLRLRPSASYSFYCTNLRKVCKEGERNAYS